MSGPSYYTTNFFSENEKTEIFMDKPVYFGCSVLELSKISLVTFGMII